MLVSQQRFSGVEPEGNEFLCERVALRGRRVSGKYARQTKVKGLILAQSERWRRGLGMHVERERGATP